MDIPISQPKRHRKRLWAGGAILGVLVLFYSLGHLKPVAPEVDRQSLLQDRVQEGAIVFHVRGTGTLVPVDVRILSDTSASDGSDRIRIR